MLRFQYIELELQTIANHCQPFLHSVRTIITDNASHILVDKPYQLGYELFARGLTAQHWGLSIWPARGSVRVWVFNFRVYASFTRSWQLNLPFYSSCTAGSTKCAAGFGTFCMFYQNVHHHSPSSCVNLFNGVVWISLATFSTRPQISCWSGGWLSQIPTLPPLVLNGTGCFTPATPGVLDPVHPAVRRWRYRIFNLCIIEPDVLNGWLGLMLLVSAMTC